MQSTKLAKLKDVYLKTGNVTANPPKTRTAQSRLTGLDYEAGKVSTDPGAIRCGIHKNAELIARLKAGEWF